MYSNYKRIMLPSALVLAVIALLAASFFVLRPHPVSADISNLPGLTTGFGFNDAQDPDTYCNECIRWVGIRYAWKNLYLFSTKSSRHPDYNGQDWKNAFNFADLKPKLLGAFRDGKYVVLGVNWKGVNSIVHVPDFVINGSPGDGYEYGRIARTKDSGSTYMPNFANVNTKFEMARTIEALVWHIENDDDYDPWRDANGHVKTIVFAVTVGMDGEFQPERDEPK